MYEKIILRWFAVKYSSIIFRKIEWGDPTSFPICMFLFLKAYLLMYFSLYVSVFCSMCVCSLCLWLVTAEAWRRYLIFWNCCYEWLPAGMPVVGTQPTSSWRAASACLLPAKPSLQLPSSFHFQCHWNLSPCLTQSLQNSWYIWSCLLSFHLPGLFGLLHGWAGLAYHWAKAIRKRFPQKHLDFYYSVVCKWREN